MRVWRIGVVESLHNLRYGSRWPDGKSYYLGLSVLFVCLLLIFKRLSSACDGEAISYYDLINKI